MKSNILKTKPKEGLESNEEFFVVDESAVELSRVRTITGGYLWDETRNLPFHRALAYDIAGDLTADQHVHHINMNKLENNLSNLIVLHKYVHWAIHCCIIVASITQRRGDITEKMLKDPDKLVLMLDEAGVSFIWLYDPSRGRVEMRVRSTR